MTETAILFVEDNDVDALVVVDAFENSTETFRCTLVRTASLSDALHELGRRSFSAILLDLNLPDSSGLATFTSMHKAAPGVPIVIMTSLKDEEAALSAVKSGAQDFIRKSGDPSSAVRAIRYAIERHKLLTELEAANARLRELDRLKNQFVATVSHELRTPIAAVKCAVENVLEGLLGEINDAQRESLSIADDYSKRLASLIENLLDIARIESGALHLNLRNADLCELARASVAGIRPLLASKEIEVVLDLPGPPVEAVVDANRVSDVVTNLLANASRFARRTITVSVRESGGVAIIGVDDDGPGIPESGLSQVFDRFVKIPEHAGRSGSGLGLSIARGVVEAHGGTIHAENRTEGGAKFMVMLPKNGPAR